MVVDTLRPATTAPPSAAPAPPARSQTARSRTARRGRDIPVNRWTATALVVALTLVSLALRVGHLSFHYWIDEAISVGISSHRLGQLPSLLRQDGSPPLYYALLHVWIGVFGHDEVATHTLSLVFAVLAVPVAYWGGAGLFGRRAGVYAGILTTGLPSGPAAPVPW